MDGNTPVAPSTRSTRRHVASVDGPDAIDVHVGQRVRLRRQMLGKSQDAMARALGVSFQQVQKYERGTNRISASRLFDVARFLAVPPGFFFQDIDLDAIAARDQTMGIKDLSDALEVDATAGARTEDLELIVAWRRMGPHQQKAIMSCIDAVTKTGSGASGNG